MGGNENARAVRVTSQDLKFYIETYGCQMNERDTETIAGLLIKEGMSQAMDISEADVIILNTCAVRESAESKVWSRFGKIRSMRRGGKPPVLVLAGCMAQLPETAERVKSKAPYISVLTGPGFIHEIPQLVREAMAKKPEDGGHKILKAVTPARTAASRDESTQLLPEGLPRRSIPGVNAYVTIMYGCDNFCSYCVVPYVRGPQVSRSFQAILEETARLCEEGYKEITLLGQNVNAYGLDVPGSPDFPALLRALDKTPGLLRLRYFTSHPRDFTQEMIEAVRDCPTVCEHFHLPLQSGSDRILKVMNRGYSRDDYLRLVERVREAIPEASITTDIIVGFPGETEEDFQDTLDMVRKCRFDGAFTFIFSPRRGTAAYRMKNQVDKKTKSLRLQELVEVQGAITRDINASCVGRDMEILVESMAEEEPGGVKGRTRTGKMVIATGSKASPGDLVNVRIVEYGTWYLKGPVAP